MATITDIQTKRDEVHDTHLPAATSNSTAAINAPSKRGAETPLRASRDATKECLTSLMDAFEMAFNDVKSAAAYEMVKQIRNDSAKAIDAAMQAVIVCEGKK